MKEIKNKQDCIDALLKKFEELSKTEKESDRYDRDLYTMMDIYKTLFG